MIARAVRGVRSSPWGTSAPGRLGCRRPLLSLADRITVTDSAVAARAATLDSVLPGPGLRHRAPKRRWFLNEWAAVPRLPQVGCTVGLCGR